MHFLPEFCQNSLTLIPVSKFRRRHWPGAMQSILRQLSVTSRSSRAWVSAKPAIRLNKNLQVETNMEFSFEVVKNDKKTRARRGVIKTAHGQIATPAFSPVATKATLKALDPKDIKKTGSQVVLGNTYHLDRKSVVVGKEG